MEKLHIERKACDNKYLHKDFHVTVDNGLTYVGTNYGDKAVEEFLTQYATNFYAPFVQIFKRDGLVAIENRFKEVYKKEEWEEFLHTFLTKNELVIKIDKCPAITYLKSIGSTPSRWYKELTYTVYKVLAEMCGIGFKVDYYCEETGKAQLVFFIKE